MKEKKEIFLVPYAHLDTQWRWEYPTTICKYIKKTLEENMALFQKYPEYQFNFTGALRYQMMKDYYPEQFEKVKELVASERWHLAGTCLDETDALIPSVESTIRNILYGDRLQKEFFGKSSRDYMIPDCFGFPANLPTILDHCGIIGFSSQKLTWGSAVGIPFELGLWTAADGSSLVSALNPGAYISRVHLPVHLSPSRLGRLNRLGKSQGIWKSFQYYGVGDIGGAPKEGSVKKVIGSIKHSEQSALKVKQGSPTEFFSKITFHERDQMDSYCGDFLLTNHSAGTLTSAAIMKRWNRKNEQMAFAVELAAVTAFQLVGLPYPREKIRSAWERMVGSQMHDILPGTSTPLAYEYAQNDEVLALNTWLSVLEDSGKAIAPCIGGDGKLMIYNPTAHRRDDPVTISLIPWKDFFHIDSTSKLEVVDSLGNRLPLIITSNEKGAYVGTFFPILLPCSWTRYDIVPQEIPSSKESSQVWLRNRDESLIIENDYLIVEVSVKGVIGSIYSKIHKEELLKKPIAYELQKEKPRKYPAWNMDWKDRKKDPFVRIEEGSSVRILQNTSLQVVLEVTTSYNKSIFIREIIVHKNSQYVELRERIRWRERGCSLKIALSANVASPKSTYNWETTRIERPVNHAKTFEFPSRQWASIHNDQFGITIIEDSKYGYDRPQDDTLRLTLLYTPAVRTFGGYRDQGSQDWGSHTIRYALYPHGGKLSDGDILGEIFNQPVRTFFIDTLNPCTNATYPSCDLELSHSLCKSIPQSIKVLAIKKAEDNDSIVIRLAERSGVTVDAAISFHYPIMSAFQINGLEEPLECTSFQGKELSVHIPAHGLVSYMVNLKSKEPHNVTLDTGLPLSLPYNTQSIGPNNRKSSAIFPSEITPEVIQSGFLTYQLKPDMLKNGVLCSGEEIYIPSGYNTISLLAGSTSQASCSKHKEDYRSSVLWLGSQNQILKEDIFSVGSLTGFVGCYDTRLWKKDPTHYKKYRRDYVWHNRCIGVDSGFLCDKRVEWYATHTHKDGIDQAYQYGYMYTIHLDVPEGATFLKLPTDSQVYLFAATLSQQNLRIKSTQYLLDHFDV